MSTPYSVFSTRAADLRTRTPGVAVTGTGTYYSDMWSGLEADGHSLTVFYTGTPTGTFTLWNTDHPNPDLANDNDWVQDANFTPVNPAGAASKFRDDAGNSKAWRKRLKYVNASGSGVVTAYVTVPRTK